MNKNVSRLCFCATYEAEKEVGEALRERRFDRRVFSLPKSCEYILAMRPGFYGLKIN